MKSEQELVDKIKTQIELNELNFYLFCDEYFQLKFLWDRDKYLSSCRYKMWTDEQMQLCTKPPKYQIQLVQRQPIEILIKK